MSPRGKLICLTKRCILWPCTIFNLHPHYGMFDIVFLWKRHARIIKKVFWNLFLYLLCTRISWMHFLHWKTKLLQENRFLEFFATLLRKQPNSNAYIFSVILEWKLCLSKEALYSLNIIQQYIWISIVTIYTFIYI